MYSIGHLESLADGNRDFMQKMIAIFISTMPKEMNQMKLFFQNNEDEKLREIAHKIKPTLKSLKIETGYNLAKQVEQFDDSKPQELLGEIIHELNLIISAVIKELEIQFKE